MLIAIAALIVLLGFGFEELGIGVTAAIFGTLVLTGVIMAVMQVPLALLGALIAVVDVCLILKIFGSDISIR